MPGEVRWAIRASAIRYHVVVAMAHHDVEALAAEAHSEAADFRCGLADLRPLRDCDHPTSLIIGPRVMVDGFF